MKQFTGQKQKWVLSLALLAVLSTQYYFQTPSNTLNSIELASRVPADEVKDVKPVSKSADNKDKEVKPAAKADDVKKADAKPEAKAESVKADAAKPEAKAEPAKEVTKTEGQASVVCPDCVTKDDFTKRLEAVLKEITELKTAIVKKDEVKSVVKKEKEPLVDEDGIPYDETAAERKARIAKTKKDKKDAEEVAKKEEAKEKQDAVNTEYSEKMAAIEEDCSGQNLQCLGQRTVDILKEYTGKGKAKPDGKTLIKGFNKYFGDNLRGALANSPSDPDLLSTMAIINAEMPTEYRAFKEKSLEIASSTTLAQAQAINTKFKMAQMLKQANKPNEALNLQMQAMQERDALQYNSQLLVNNVQAGVQESNDSATLKYLQTIYLPNVNKLIQSLIDTSGNSSLGTNTTTNGTDFATRANNRGSTTSNILANGNNGGNTLNNALNGNNGAALNNNVGNNNGVQIGTPTNNRQIINSRMLGQ